MPTSAFALDIQHVRSTIQRRAARRLEASHRASVVLILHPSPDDVGLLLIRRAERTGDPWSGHMGLPGGHQHGQDRDALHTALRETREEIGVNLLELGECLGALDDIQASARGHTIDLAVTPFVFQVGASPRFEPSAEVAEVIWVSLSGLASGSHFVCHSVEFDGRVAVLPGWDVGERIIWGLTYRMITGLLRRILIEADRSSCNASETES